MISSPGTHTKFLRFCRQLAAFQKQEYSWRQAWRRWSLEYGEVYLRRLILFLLVTGLAPAIFMDAWKRTALKKLSILKKKSIKELH